ncbi:endonuclease/exonuclease/phosphatase family protein [Streptomyces broussonetiae]|uniref:Endonuclease/exonuclease/phosphatase domain-containing protein n=1 Tax=Streptomyces broussonetiae TaxID=2686304 RepID=A0A6I6MTB5_9ACTN|nr:endonuclease/exonuclease/phosphatase family protein [Streptomyces broussonetiae]QHA02234.1 hypothetical protein GQF42_01855 [Streptomyces broussonetiae]
MQRRTDFVPGDGTTSAFGDGNPEDRCPQLAERIRGAADRVDVVMLCEVVDRHRYGHKQLARALADLDLGAALLAPSRSGYGTALLYRWEILSRWRRHSPDFGTEALHGLAVTSFDIPACAATRGYRYGPPARAALSIMAAALATVDAHLQG